MDRVWIEARRDALIDGVIGQLALPLVVTPFAIAILFLAILPPWMSAAVALCVSVPFKKSIET